MSANLSDINIAANRDRYRELVSLAKATNATDLDSRLAYIGAAAESAWLHHPGFFTDRDLEQLAAPTGRRRTNTATDTTKDTERVLHVLTQAIEIGGHTRLAMRWMELDANRTHSIVLTGQAQEATPESLSAMVRRRGGTTYYLDRRPGGLSKRVIRLNLLAAEFDYIVLHTHPSDPLPLAAFSVKTSAPVLLLNHADHVFWIGATVADLVVSIREAGKALAGSRRGIVDHRSIVLPIPTPPVGPRHTSAARAKERLALPPDAVLLLTIASGYKFTATTEPGFANAHTEILERTPNLHHVVVGVDPDSEPWKRAASRTGGRLRAIGPTPDLERFFTAADVYVDSFPFASLTSALDAMAHGIPCASFDPFNGASPVLRLGDTSNMLLYYEGPDIGGYAEAIQRLAGDLDERAAAGAQAAEAIRSRHWGDGWKEQLEAVYAAARRSTSREPDWSIDPEAVGTPSELDRNLADFQARHAPLDATPGLVTGRFLSALPRRRAVRTLGVPPNWHGRMRILLPDWSMHAVGTATRTIQKMLRARARP